MSEPATILVVDDNSTNRMKMRLAVRNLGHSAEVAENGAVALQMLREGAFDAVLLDIVMPEVDGYEVLRTLKADENLRDIPVIVISSLDDEMDSVVKAIELGADDFLPKSFDPVLLKARLGSSLTKKRFRDEERDYMRRVARLTQAAEVLEAGNFHPQELMIDDIAGHDDPLGRLAAVFGDMAQDIYERERRLLRSVLTMKGALLVLAVGAVWGLTPALSRMAAGLGSNPIGLAVWVNMIAATVCLSIAAWRGRLPQITWATARFLLFWAVVAGISQRLVTFWVAENVEASTLSVIVTLSGFMVFAFAALMGLEKATVRRLTGLMLGLAGVTVVMLTRDPLADAGDFLWMLMALLLPLLFAVESILMAARRPEGVDLIAACGIMMALSAAFLFPLAVASGNLVALQPTVGRLEVLVVLIGLASATSLVLAFHLVATAGAVFASLSAYAMTIAGVVWGMLLLSEELSLLAWGALALILFGAWLVEPKGADEQVRLDLRFVRRRGVPATPQSPGTLPSRSAARPHDRAPTDSQLAPDAPIADVRL
jgi:CheY-like chemotaxis protein